MARYAAEGVRVLVETCTGGEAGSILNPAMDRQDVGADLPAGRRREVARGASVRGVVHRWTGVIAAGPPALRRPETARAASLLGGAHHSTGFSDSVLPRGDPKPPLPEGCFALVDDEVATRALVARIREFRPHVLITYDENGGYPHP